MGAVAALLALACADVAWAQVELGPLPEGPRCQALDLWHISPRGIYPSRPCGTFEVDIDAGAIWSRSHTARRIRGGLAYGGLVRYRARLPLLVEVAFSPGRTLWGPDGSATFGAAHAAVGLDLRGLALTVAIGRVWVKETATPALAEAAWTGGMGIRLGASDGLTLRMRLRLAGGRARGSSILPRSVPEASLQIPLYPQHTLLKHYLYLGMEYGLRYVPDFWIGTAHQLVRRRWGALLLRVGVHLLYDVRANDDAWVGRSVRLGLEWRGPNRGPAAF